MLKPSSNGRHNSLKKKQGFNAWLARKKKTNAAATMVSLKKGRWQEKDDGVSSELFGSLRRGGGSAVGGLRLRAFLWKISEADWQLA